MPRPHFPSGRAAHGVATKRTTQSFPSRRHSLSIFNSNHPIMSRGRLSASAAAVRDHRFACCRRVDDVRLDAGDRRRRRYVRLADFASPSFATVVDRVKPAVVSVKVNIEEVASHSDDLSGQMDNLPPDVQQFFNRTVKRTAEPPTGAKRRGAWRSAPAF